MIFDMWVSDSVFVCPTCWLTWITVVTLRWLCNLSSQWVRQNMFIHLEEMEKPWQIIALHWSSLIHESYYYFWLLHTGSRLVEWQPLVSGQAGLLSCLEACYCLDPGTSFSALEQPAPSSHQRIHHRYQVRSVPATPPKHCLFWWLVHTSMCEKWTGKRKRFIIWFLHLGLCTFNC